MNELETIDQLEMVYLYHLGIPYEMDRTNPFRVKMIFKGDVDFIKSKVEDFWSGKTKVDALRYSYDWQSVKRLLWVGEKYDPNFYKNKRASDQAEADGRTIKGVHQ